MVASGRVTEDSGYVCTVASVKNSVVLDQERNGKMKTCHILGKHQWFPFFFPLTFIFTSQYYPVITRAGYINIPLF